MSKEKRSSEEGRKEGNGLNEVRIKINKPSSAQGLRHRVRGRGRVR